MKHIRSLIAAIIFLSLSGFAPEGEKIDTSGPDENYLSECDYLTKEEKAVYYYLNYAREYPKSFAENCVKTFELPSDYIEPKDFKKKRTSLYKMLVKMEPVGKLVPDKTLYESAFCFASEGGKRGIVGHNRSRTGCAGNYDAESCQYGFNDGYSIILMLLIDTGKENNDLGHRKMCLNKDLTKLGVSIRPHKKYEYNTILDFF